MQPTSNNIWYNAHKTTAIVEKMCIFAPRGGSFEIWREQMDVTVVVTVCTTGIVLCLVYIVVLVAKSLKSKFTKLGKEEFEIDEDVLTVSVKGK